jgi:hypothetical protein
VGAGVFLLFGADEREAKKSAKKAKAPSSKEKSANSRFPHTGSPVPEPKAAGKWES